MGSEVLRRQINTEFKARAKPRAIGDAETIEHAIARGVPIEVIPSATVARIGYPRPHFRKGKGTDS